MWPETDRKSAKTRIYILVSHHDRYQVKGSWVMGFDRSDCPCAVHPPAGGPGEAPDVRLKLKLPLWPTRPNDDGPKAH
jgi:hypothetical protein